ncbi:MAG: choice-of-anchor J domain-containing protein [Candidatus Cloacimonadota bacterium]
MNKLSLTLLITALLLAVSVQAVNLLEEDFEGIFPGDRWQLAGTPTWDDRSDEYHSGGWAAWCAGSDMDPSEGYYADNMDAKMSWGPFDLENINNANLSFWYKVNAENNYDTFKVGIYRLSGDDEWTWNELLSTSATPDGEWAQANLDLSGYIGEGDLKLAFRFVTDGSVNNLIGAWIDDIVLSTDSAGPRSSVGTLIGDSYEPDDAPYQFNTLIIRSLEQSQAHSLHIEHDEDWFRFRGELGRKYIFKSRSEFDPMVHLYNDEGTIELASNDDNILDEAGGLDFGFSFFPPQTAWYKLKVVGYNGATGSYDILYSYEAVEMGEPDANEPNNIQEQATLLSITENSQSLNLNFHYEADSDWFAFEAQGNRVYEFRSESDGKDPVVQLLNSEGEQLMSADDNGEDNDFLMSWPATEPGTYYLQISDYSHNLGDYSLQFSYAAITEDAPEPNNSISEAKPLNFTGEMQSQILSIHSSEDKDWFRLELRPNLIYKLHSTGGMDVKAALYSEDGETALLSNDDGAEEQNFRLEFAGMEAGTYYLKVEGYDDRIGIYHLHYVSEENPGDQFEPNNDRSNATPLEINQQAGSQNHTLHYGMDEDWFRFDFEAGKTYVFSSLGSIDMKAGLYFGENTESEIEDDDSGDESNFRLSYTAGENGTAFLKVTSYSGEVTGNYQLQYYWEMGDLDEYEPDNTAENATNLIISHAQQKQSHTLHSPLDVDWYRIYLKAGQNYVFGTESEFDTVGYLYPMDSEELLAENDDKPNSDDSDFEIRFRPESSGFYFLKVKPYGSSYGDYFLLYE